MAQQNEKYSAVVIGVSAGGLNVLTKILEKLPRDFALPVVVVQHRSKEEKELLEELLQLKCKIKIKQADEKESIESGVVYIAPPDYHLLVEKNRTFSLSSEPPVNFSRPSIDVLFETASEAYGSGLVGIVLTGANHDGAAGIAYIKKHRGITIAQNPRSAQFPIMPQAAIDTSFVKHIFDLDEIADFLLKVGQNPQTNDASESTHFNS